MIFTTFLAPLIQGFLLLLPLIDNGIQVWNTFSVNSTKFSFGVIHQTVTVDHLRPNLSKYFVMSPSRDERFSVQLGLASDHFPFSSKSKIDQNELKF
jgi:hypothetical protein